MRTFRLILVGLVVAMLFIATMTQGQVQPSDSVLAKLMRGETLRVGYAQYSAYSFKDPRTGEVDGLSIRLAQYIANLFKVEMILEETDWGLVTLALQGRIDLFVSPIFILPERDKVIDFSLPYAFFDYAIGVVRKGETRFETWREMNDPAIKVAVVRGEGSHLWALENIPQATLIVVEPAPLGGFHLAFLEVLEGRADIALADKRTVIDLLRLRGDEFEARWLDDPPATSPGALALPEGDHLFQVFLNGVISTLCADGILERWAQEFDAVEVDCRR
jgi:ABC-type amino acid transport substrate-binding protein